MLGSQFIFQLKTKIYIFNLQKISKMHVCFPIVWQSYFCKIFIFIGHLNSGVLKFALQVLDVTYITLFHNARSKNDQE